MAVLADGGLGPMAGQNHHFSHYAPQPLPYAIDRYMREVDCLYGVLERRLHDRTFIAGEDHSIADMTCYPWMFLHRRGQQDITTGHAGLDDLAQDGGVLMVEAPEIWRNSSRPLRNSRMIRRISPGLVDADRELTHQVKDAVGADTA